MGKIKNRRLSPRPFPLLCLDRDRRLGLRLISGESLTNALDSVREEGISVCRLSQGLSAVVDAKTLAEAILHAEKQEAVERKRRTSWRTACCDCCGLPLWCANHAASEKHWTLERGSFGTGEWKGVRLPGRALLELFCSVTAWSGDNDFCAMCTKTRTPWTKFIFADVVQSPWLLQSYDAFLDGQGIPGRHDPSWGRLLNQACDIIDLEKAVEAKMETVGVKMETRVR